MAYKRNLLQSKVKRASSEFVFELFRLHGSAEKSELGCDFYETFLRF